MRWPKRHLRPTHVSDAAPAAMVRRSDGGYRAMAIPWTAARATKRRQVSWLAGHSLMHGLPGHAEFNVRPSGCFRPKVEAMFIALAAYSCRDSLGFGSAKAGPHRVPELSPLGHRRDLLTTALRRSRQSNIPNLTRCQVFAQLALGFQAWPFWSFRLRYVDRRHKSQAAT